MTDDNTGGVDPDLQRALQEAIDRAMAGDEILSPANNTTTTTPINAPVVSPQPVPVLNTIDSKYGVPPIFTGGSPHETPAVHPILAVLPHKPPDMVPTVLAESSHKSPVVVPTVFPGSSQLAVSVKAKALKASRSAQPLIVKRPALITGRETKLGLPTPEDMIRTYLATKSDVPTLELAKVVYGRKGTTGQVNPLLYDMAKRRLLLVVKDSNGSKPKWSLTTTNKIVLPQEPTDSTQ